MRVIEKRWGEVTIKKQRSKKNEFDGTKSFSINQTETNYSIEEYLEILKISTNLTKELKFKKLKSEINKLFGLSKR